MYKANGNKSFDGLFGLLPENIIYELELLKEKGKIDELNEIRLRANGRQSLVISGEEYELQNADLCEKDISQLVYKLCSGSVYAYANELKKGYISAFGTRTGVCGKALYGDNGICGFSSYYSVNIRFPSHIPQASDELLNYISENGSEKTGGVLVVSPPCHGKTTLLRALACALSKGYYDKGAYRKRRVCIIDEREEIYLKGVFDNSFADILSCYPKKEGIELCTRVMSPEYIVCDEIGNTDEAEAVCDSASKGVIFAASCHGVSMEDIMKKKSIKRLFDEGVFKTVCEISLRNKKRTVKVRSVPC